MNDSKKVGPRTSSGGPKRAMKSFAQARAEGQEGRVKRDVGGGVSARGC